LSAEFLTSFAKRPLGGTKSDFATRLSSSNWWNGRHSAGNPFLGATSTALHGRVFGRQTDSHAHASRGTWHLIDSVVVDGLLLNVPLRNTVAPGFDGLPVEEFARGRFARAARLFLRLQTFRRSVPAYRACFAKRRDALRFHTLRAKSRRSGICAFPAFDRRLPGHGSIAAVEQRSGLRCLKVRKAPRENHTVRKTPRENETLRKTPRQIDTVRKTPHTCSLPETGRVLQIESGLFCDARRSHEVTWDNLGRKFDRRFASRSQAPASERNCSMLRFLRRDRRPAWIAHCTCEGEAGASRVCVPKLELGNEGTGNEGTGDGQNGRERGGCHFGFFWGGPQKSPLVLLRQSALLPTPWPLTSDRSPVRGEG
jgi:hypothetical protein